MYARGVMYVGSGFTLCIYVCYSMLSVNVGIFVRYVRYVLYVRYVMFAFCYVCVGHGMYALFIVVCMCGYICRDVKCICMCAAL